MKDILQCQFGCGKRIRHETVEFSDGLKIRVPREVDNSIHNCPNLPEFDPYYFETAPEGDLLEPTDEKDRDDFLEEHDYAWDKEDVSTHFSELADGLVAIDGLEFTNIRHSVKKYLVKQLDYVPHFFYTINLWSADEDLPACLQTDDKCYGQFLPAELLGLFYQMDGGLEGLENAKKCFKILEETGWIKTVGRVNQTPSQKIEEIDEDIEDIKQEFDGYTVPIYSELKQLPQSIRLKHDEEKGLIGDDVKINNQNLREEINQFEEEDLHHFILYKFPGTKLIEKLKNTKEYPKETTLYEKYEGMLKAEKEKSLLEKQATPLAYLDFGDKNTIVRGIIKKTHWYYLNDIKNRRNELSHTDDTPKELKKARQVDEIALNTIIRSQIKIVKNYFERLKNELET